MRADRANSLKQRLRKQAESFEFDALIEGVSTIRQDLEPPVPVEAAPPTPAAPDTPSTPKPTIAAPKPAPFGAPAPAPRRYLTRSAERDERLRSVLSALGKRLLSEASLLRDAFTSRDTTLSGMHLARINQLLDLLQSVDPQGDMARQMATDAAPPEGRAWPRSTWSVYEFAGSPLSALLPADVSETFLQTVMVAAWGIDSRPIP